MDPVHILIDPVHGPGPRRGSMDQGSMDQGSMFCTFPSGAHTVRRAPVTVQFIG